MSIFIWTSIFSKYVVLLCTQDSYPEYSSVEINSSYSTASSSDVHTTQTITGFSFALIPDQSDTQTLDPSCDAWFELFNKLQTHNDQLLTESKYPIPTPARLAVTDSYCGLSRISLWLSFNCNSTLNATLPLFSTIAHFTVFCAKIIWICCPRVLIDTSLLTNLPTPSTGHEILVLFIG